MRKAMAVVVLALAACSSGSANEQACEDLKGGNLDGPVTQEALVSRLGRAGAIAERPLSDQLAIMVAAANTGEQSVYEAAAAKVAVLCEG